MEIRTGVVLPTAGAQWGEKLDLPALIDFAVDAEELGYDAVWAGDTLLRPVADPLTTLAAVAARTERVGIGTAALLPAFRRPVQAARELATLDLLSTGRLTVTVGAGFPGRSEREYAATEVPWARRFARLDETVALWRQLWSTEGPSQFHGTVLRLDDIPESLAPHRPGGPPIWLGGFTPAAFRRTGRLYDGWLPYPPQAADYAAGLAAVRAAATEAGRPAEAVAPALFVTVLLTDAADGGRAELDAYCRASYRLPVEVVETIQLVVSGTPERVLAALNGHLAAGARQLLIRIAGLDIHTQRTQLRRIAELKPALISGQIRSVPGQQLDEVTRDAT
ncbi:LLM class flavin-dependent oxidoreductase [Kitasatospora azatica]|uniref:LLM class flavin-dependent oxidoreductase n=1 Tax=Kitasatospora azatica TaxID=58347 RepID=UPI00068E6FA6|nr:LLM class flavin-dependent oxidoreductase [Kitasatospora azatica]